MTINVVALRFLLSLALVAASVVLPACTTGTTPADASAAAVEPGAATADIGETPDACTPRPNATHLRIVVFHDKTASSDRTRTEPLTDEHLVRLVTLICHAGGTLALGFISDDSNTTLARLTLPEPPRAPALESIPQNPLEAADVEARNAVRTSAYEQAVKGWRELADVRIGRFFKDADALAESVDKAKRTDVIQALRRTGRLLEEPAPEPTHAWAIYNSDGDDNVRHKGVPKSLNGRLLAVNGAGHAGVLGRYDPTLFESLSAAIDYLERVETLAEKPEPGPR